MFLEIVLLIVGMILLIKGADFFVSGASKIARAIKIPSLVIGLTLVSIGTSAPELSVSITSAIKGMNDMSLGNIVGSNIFNTFFVIGFSSLFTPLVISKNMKKYDIPILIGIYLMLLLFGLIITPLELTFLESIVIFGLFFIYIAFLIIRSKNEVQQETNEGNKRKWYINLLFVIVGLAGIFFGGNLVVDNASKIAIKLGMSELLVGLTIVAVGTSLPELVTSVVATKRGENDIAIGNAIGSCIFNIILILGISGIISPITLALTSLVDLMVMLTSILCIFLMTIKSSKIDRIGGILLILFYVIYLSYIIIRNLT